jgi:hypothetical protein
MNIFVKISSIMSGGTEISKDITKSEYYSVQTMLHTFSEPNSKRSSTIAGPLDDFKEFHPSIVHYCQCFTILTGNRHKITSTMTAIQVYMTEGNDYRLLSESEEIFPIYVLLKSNNAVAILVNKVDPGQHLLTYIGKKFKVQSGKGQGDTSIKRMSVIKAVISKYSGFVINPLLVSPSFLFLPAFNFFFFFLSIIAIFLAAILISCRFI